MKRAVLLVLLLAIPLAAAQLPTTVTVSPSANATTTSTLQCLVNATGGGALTANVTWYLNGTLHGADDQTLTLTSGTQNGTNSTGDVKPYETVKGELWTCQATVTNGTDTNITNSSAITIEDSPPIVTYPIVQQNATEDHPFGPITATAYDPDGDPITWISQDQSKGQYSGTQLFTIQSDGTISFTADQPENGNHSMALIATDGTLFGGRVVVFDLLPFDDPPILSDIQNQTANVTIPFSLIVNASDEENDTLAYNISSDIPSLSIAQVDNTHANISFTPTYAELGNHTVTVTVYETKNESKNDTKTFVIDVYSNNRPPAIDTILYQNTSQGGVLNLTVNATDNDTTNTLNFSVIGNCPITNPWTITTLSTNHSDAIGQIYVANVTNDQVICRNVTLMVRDYVGTTPLTNDTRTLVLNITNVNDPPTVHELSGYAGNTESQQNMSNLTASTGLPFVYHVNATDPDTLTYEGEVLNYSDNTTLFTINNSTGLINFTPNQSEVGDYAINITVMDDQGLWDSRNLTLHVVNNTFPTLIPVPNMMCQEDANCSVSLEAYDPDPGENETFTVRNVNYSTNSNSTVDPTFTLIKTSWNTSTVWKNFTNSMVGNYTYNITVSDHYGATDSQLWNLTVNNTNDPPTYDENFTLPSPIVAMHPMTLLVNASDKDFLNGFENLTLTVQLNGPNPSLLNVTKLSSMQWKVVADPSTGDIGQYNASFVVTDIAGANATRNLSFTVYNKSRPPVILTVYPFWNSSTNQTQLSFANASPFSGSTSINSSEASTLRLNLTYMDPDTALGNLTVTWTGDNKTLKTVAGTSDPALTLNYGYFDAGTHIYKVNVSDNRYESDTFQWNVTVANVNRAPYLVHNITNLTINQTTTITDYMNAFLDPDDDLNSNGVLDPNETNHLTYTYSSSPYLKISFIWPNTTLTPLKTGTAHIVYTATDSGGLSAKSNNVTYTVIMPPQQQQQTSSSSSGGGGGGGGASVSTPVPVPTISSPNSIQILSPSPVTIYYNQTIAAPLTVRNPGDTTLYGVKLSATAAVKNVTFAFSTDQYATLAPHEEHNLTLYISNYRSSGTYEVKVLAQADQPKVNDSTLIYVNSIEKGSEGSAVQTRVTFAKDLVASNPECIELNTLVKEAQRAVDTGQIQEADKLLNAVINGCRYLISTSGARQETPQGLDLSWLANFRYANEVLIGLVVLLGGIAVLLVMHYRESTRED